MPSPDDKSYIDRLKESLYSRTAPDVRTRRKMRFTEKESNVPTAWERPPEIPDQPVLNEHYEDHSMSFFTKLLIGSAIFCVIAVGLGAYLFLNGANLISANNIDIQISGPVSIPGGEPVSFDIRVRNKNNVALQTADLSVDFPAGTTDPNDTAKELKSYRELLGDIPAGGSAEKTVKAVIFGEENLQKEILVKVTYKVKGSESLFTKTQSYEVLINSSPMSLTISSFKEITSGQEFDLKVSLKSNSEETLKNVILKAAYPFGFTFVSANLKPLSDNATWRIGDIPPGGERTITIKGKLEGEDEDTRVFRFSAGAESAPNSMVIGTQYALSQDEIAIQKPFISLKVSIDNDDPSAPTHAGQFGQPQRVEISWFNNLPVSVSNAEIWAKLSGSAYDKASVQPEGGTFDSANNQIIWNQRTNSELGSVGAGDSGTVTFSVIPRDNSASGNKIINPSISISVSVAADRTQEAGVPGSLASAATRVINVLPNVSLSGRIVRTSGPFANTGPMPPKAEAKTTYTVIWTVDNTSSSVGNASVTATLPTYVKWLSMASPAAEDVKYDQNTGTVTWNIGSVGTYTAGSGSRREIAFQISFEPSVNQAGQSATLINEAHLHATDDFTGAALDSTQGMLSTRFSTDPAYRDGDDKVAQ